MFWLYKSMKEVCKMELLITRYWAKTLQKLQNVLNLDREVSKWSWEHIMRGKKEEIVPIRGQVVQKANAVIFSLSDNTLLSNKVFLAALLKAEKRENTKEPRSV